MNEHVHLTECASRRIDDLFRDECDCGAELPCGDGDCDQCYPVFDDQEDTA